MVAPTMLAAAAPIIGSVLGGLFGRSSAKRSMTFQREMAQKGHQYEVADLRAAGLNPILSATGGPGAKASGGAVPTTPDFATSAVAMLKIKAEIENIEANTLKTLTEEGKERVGGEIGRDLDRLYRGTKDTFSAKNLRENRAKHNRELTKTPSKLQKRIDRAKKPGYHIGIGGTNKSNPSWYQPK